ncbi:MAG: biopolymer transporter ExbD [Magnetococcales bacterium]|nr:biopolymer transporter ExbD [Magnetococcales bacterium]NGZ27683.1 biopolymer transporter ExbD [Magnetococcales bacterium]
MSFSQQSDDADQPMAEINITPLVDVMLILLVIFIIAAPLMAQAMRVSLPEVKAAAEKVESPLTLTVQADGSMLADDQSITQDQLAPLLAQRLTQQADLVVRLAADSQTPYGTLAKILSIAQESGALRIAFATAPLRTPAP